MEVNGISRAELAQQLDNLGISENKNHILSIFDEIDKDQALNNVQHDDDKLSGIEMHELLQRAKDYLGEKTDQLRKVFIKTGGYAEHKFIEWQGADSEEITYYNEYGDRIHTAIDKNRNQWADHDWYYFKESQPKKWSAER